MANLLLPAPGGAPRLCYGWDGTDWRALTVDAVGNLQVDVAASALPAGAATAAKQDTMITALQVIDDLRGALDSVGTDELNVNIETSVTLDVDSELAAAVALDDALANPTVPLVGAAGLQFNGTAWERVHGNMGYTLLPLDARVATVGSVGQVNRSARGLLVIVRVTAVSGSPSLIPRLVISTETGLDFVMWNAAAALTAVGQWAYLFYPGTLDVGLWTEKLSCVIPRNWYFVMVHGTADSVTYIVRGWYLL